jgi:hypothetical protein
MKIIKICNQALIFLFFLTSTLSKNAVAQENASKYLRPSMTTMYLDEDDPSKKEILNYIISSVNNTELPQFDILKIKTNKVILKNKPQQPKKPIYSGRKEDFSKDLGISVRYEIDLKNYNEAIKKGITLKVQELSKEIIRSLFMSDFKGNMSDELIKKRGLYTANDNDVIKNKASEISRLSELGYKLIEKTYLTIYELDDFTKIDKEYYDNEERKRIARSISLGAKPSDVSSNERLNLRLDEGYSLLIKAYTFKLSKSWFENFFQLYWVDATQTDSERMSKINALNNLTIPLDLVCINKIGLNAFAPYGSSPSMYKLFENTDQNIQDLVFKKASKKIIDLAAKATILEAYPVKIKIGTKEGVFVDQRYFVYEIRKKSEADKETLKRVAIIRAKSPIANNQVNATGNSLTTNFKQVSGKKVYPGMIVIQKESNNVMYSIDYYKTKSGSGLGFSYEFSIFSSKAMGQNVKSTKGPAGLYNGLEIVILPDRFFGTITTAKEIYLLKTGNIFLYPKVGIGAVDVEALYIDASLGLGANITPWFTVISKINYAPQLNSINTISIGGKIRL